MGGASSLAKGHSTGSTQSMMERRSTLQHLGRVHALGLAGGTGRALMDAMAGDLKPVLMEIWLV